MGNNDIVSRKAFAKYMAAKYGGIIVAPKGGFQVDDLAEAFDAGYDAAVADEYE